MIAKLSTVKADGKTTCCDAYTSISIDDEIEYCKGCFEEVLNPSPDRTEVELP